MKAIPSIAKRPKLKPGEDFAYLRQEGIQLIQQLNGENWTDYNLHDPGLTLLEALSYHISELTLRSGLDIKDILASGKQNVEQVLFAPEVILTNQAVNNHDYRKFIIDIAGVRNAWIIPLSVNEAGNISGIYDVLLEFDEDATLGDLNSNTIYQTVSVEINPGDSRVYELVFTFPYWDDESVRAFREELNIISIRTPGETSVALNRISNPSDENDYYVELEVDHSGGVTDVFSVTVQIQPRITDDLVERLAVESQLEDLLSAITSVTGELPLIAYFNQRATAASDIALQVSAQLHGNRNLCEDFRNIKAVKIQEIAVNANIQLLNSVNIEKYLAQLVYALNTFFSPPIKHFSAQALFEEGVPIESIFEGSKLKNSVIQSNDLVDLPRSDNQGRTGSIYVSDLINLFIHIAESDDSIRYTEPGKQAIALSKLSISNFVNGKIVIEGASNCLTLVKPDLYKPRFSLNKSKIQFFKNDILINYNQELVYTLYQALLQSNQPSPGGNFKMPFPQGELLSISTFYSTQYDLPAIYGLGKNVLPNSFASDRRAKAEQYRGYICILDHVLANITGQLSNVNELFSIDLKSIKTYFNENLYNIPYLDRLLVSYINSGDTWVDFQADDENQYQQKLSDLSESREVFCDRRNRFLNHLLSRFAFSLQIYESWRYEEIAPITNDSAEFRLQELELKQDFIQDKINVLKQYPVLSSQRFKALDYTNDVWDTENVTGLERRLITFLGLNRFERRSFYNELNDFIQIIESTPGVFVYEILGLDGAIILQSVDNFPDSGSALLSARALVRQGSIRSNFYIESQNIAGLEVHRVGFQTNPALLPILEAMSPLSFEQEWEARIAIRSIIRAIKEISSGIYVIENVLLRPLAAEPERLEIPTTTGSLLSDPYSMRIVIIFPSGYERNFGTANAPIFSASPAHFQNDRFRNYTLELVQQETPAHVLADVFWVDQNTGIDDAATPSLSNIGAKWRSWLEAKSSGSPTLSVARAELIAVLNELYANQL